MESPGKVKKGSMVIFFKICYKSLEKMSLKFLKKGSMVNIFQNLQEFCRVTWFITTVHNKEMCTLWYFFQKTCTNQIVYLKWTLAILKKMPIYCPLGKYKLLICSFLEHYQTVIFNDDDDDDDDDDDGKDVWCMANVHQIFLVLNLTIIFIMPFTCNNATLVFFNEMLFIY